MHQHPCGATGHLPRRCSPDRPFFCDEENEYFAFSFDIAQRLHAVREVVIGGGGIVGRKVNAELLECRRRTILNAAANCFRRRGFDQTAMAEICQEASMSPGALYRYFSSKTEIIGEIAAMWSESAGTCDAGEGEFYTWLRETARAYLSKLLGEDAAIVTEILARGIRDDDLSRVLLSYDEPRSLRWIAVMRRAQESGAIDSQIDVLRAAETLFGVLVGIGTRISYLGGDDVDAATEQFCAFASRFLDANGARGNCR
jgi:TetR/AcrR family transcriptional regulator, repressor for uid operon